MELSKCFCIRLWGNPAKFLTVTFSTQDNMLHVVETEKENSALMFIDRQLALNFMSKLKVKQDKLAVKQTSSVYSIIDVSQELDIPGAYLETYRVGRLLKARPDFLTKYKEVALEEFIDDTGTLKLTDQIIQQTYGGRTIPANAICNPAIKKLLIDLSDGRGSYKHLVLAPHAIDHCENLEEVELILDHITFHQDVLVNCPSLKSLNIEKCKLSVEVNSFKNCPNFDNIIGENNLYVSTEFKNNYPSIFPGCPIGSQFIDIGEKLVQMIQNKFSDCSISDVFAEDSNQIFLEFSVRSPEIRNCVSTKDNIDMCHMFGWHGPNKTVWVDANLTPQVKYKVRITLSSTSGEIMMKNEIVDQHIEDLSAILNTLSDNIQKLSQKELSEALEDNVIEYKGFRIENFPYNYEVAGNKHFVDAWIIQSPYYIGDQDNRHFLPIYPEDENGNVIEFSSFGQAKNYIEKYMLTKRGKLKIKYGDEAHFVLDNISDVDIDESLTESMEDFVMKKTNTYSKLKGQIVCNCGSQTDEIIHELEGHYKIITYMPDPSKKGRNIVSYSK